MNLPRLLISGLSGGSGKTTVSLGLARHLSHALIPTLAPASSSENHDEKGEPCAPIKSTGIYPANPAQIVWRYAPQYQTKKLLGNQPNKISPLQIPPSPLGTSFPCPTPAPACIEDTPAGSSKKGSVETPSTGFMPAVSVPYSPPGWEEAFAQSYAPRPVQTFKKGPDYIDAAWLGLAGQCTTKTLDPFFSSPTVLQTLFCQGAHQAGCALIEGNRGLYDGVDSAGTCSSAHLAKVLKTPVLLVVDCTKMTRTVAALVLGCIQFDKDLTIGGVILNKLGTARQENIIREAITQYTDVPVLGALPRLRQPLLPERSMGLAAIQGDSSEHLEAVCKFITEHVDTKAIWQLAARPLYKDTNNAPLLPPDTPTCGSHHLFKARTYTQCDSSAATPCPSFSTLTPAPLSPHSISPSPSPSPLPKQEMRAIDSSLSPQAALVEEKAPSLGAPLGHDNSQPASQPQQVKNTSQAVPTIGYVHDKAIWFYYAENLEALCKAGARLRKLSLFDPTHWDTVDGIYMGGGQIDSYAEELSQSPQISLLRQRAYEGTPLYMEGAALSLACKEVHIQGTAYPMARIFDATMTLGKRPQGLGYIQGSLTKETPFYPLGTSLVGHQFNFFTFSALSPLCGTLHLEKGTGIYQYEEQGEGKEYDGLVHSNTWASLTHIFAPATPHWAERFVQLCISKTS